MWKSMDSVRLVSFGGEALTCSVVSKYSVNVPHLKIVNSYGPAECTITSNAFCFGKTMLTSITLGPPLPNYRCLVLDSQLRPCMVGAVGELFIGGAGLMRGYRGRDDLTRQVFAEQISWPEAGVAAPATFYKSGDLVRLTPDGQLVYIGRRDGQVRERCGRDACIEHSMTCGAARRR